MIGFRTVFIKGKLWRSLPFGFALLSRPSSSSKTYNYFSFLHYFLLFKSLYFRWDSDFNTSNSMSWWHVVKFRDSGFDLSSYSSNTRRKIRKSLSLFDYHLCDRDYIASNCYNVYLAASSRYDTHEQIFAKDKFSSAVLSLPQNCEFWVATCNLTGVPVAFCDCYVNDSVSFVNTIWFHPEYLKSYLSYGFFYCLAQHYLGSLSFEYLSDGSKSISHDTNIHQFLISNFNFTKAYSRLHVSYHFLLIPFVFLIYPFRSYFYDSKFFLFRKLVILLKLESNRRASNV